LHESVFWILFQPLQSKIYPTSVRILLGHSCAVLHLFIPDNRSVNHPAQPSRQLSNAIYHEQII
jgi:hypothetical protein